MRYRRRSLFFLLPLVSCTSGPPRASEPPNLIHGGWIREKSDLVTPADAPQSLQSLNPVKVWRVKYRGPQDITAIWILYPHETVAFEAMQKMNKGPAVRPFQRGAFFVVLDAAGIPAQALGDFQEGVIKALP